MRVTVEKSTASGTVCAPPSKSMAHRALICAALSDKSTVRNIAWSDDIKATAACLRAMGAQTEASDGQVSIGGLDPFNVKDVQLSCGESGSTLRFLMPLGMLSGSNIRFTGSKRLMERPLEVYEEICAARGILMRRDGEGVNIRGRLAGGKFTVPGDISSQFVTGLLFALPLVATDSTIEVTGRFESRPYVELTMQALSDFGVRISVGGCSFSVKGGQRPKPTEYTVEGDCSNAAFLAGFNVLGGNVSVTGLKADTLQGDRVYARMFKELLQGRKDFDLSDCPDLAPVMFALSAATGGAKFTGTARLKLKESDRSSAMAEELAKFGIETDIGENTVTIKNGVLKKPLIPLYGHNDHRIVMALSLLCSVTGGEIEGAEAVSKSFADFFERIEQINVKVKKYEA